MTARDSRGRFVKPNVAAADLVLEVAVAEAVEVLRRGVWRGVWRGTQVEADHVHIARTALHHAAQTADLLLRRSA